MLPATTIRAAALSLLFLGPVACAAPTDVEADSESDTASFAATATSLSSVLAQPGTWALQADTRKAEPGSTLALTFAPDGRFVGAKLRSNVVFVGGQYVLCDARTTCPKNLPEGAWESPLTTNFSGTFRAKAGVLSLGQARPALKVSSRDSIEIEGVAYRLSRPLLPDQNILPRGFDHSLAQCYSQSDCPSFSYTDPQGRVRTDRQTCHTSRNIFTSSLTGTCGLSEAFVGNGARGYTAAAK